MALLEVNNLKKIYKTDKSFIANITRDRFSNGEGKIRINTNIKGKNVYIISDIANYDITYKMYGFIHHMLHINATGKIMK